MPTVTQPARVLARTGIQTSLAERLALLGIALFCPLSWRGFQCPLPTRESRWDPLGSDTGGSWLGNFRPRNWVPPKLPSSWVIAAARSCYWLLNFRLSKSTFLGSPSPLPYVMSGKAYTWLPGGCYSQMRHPFPSQRCLAACHSAYWELVLTNNSILGICFQG